MYYSFVLSIMELDTVWDYIAVAVQIVTTIVILALLTYTCVVIDDLHSVNSRDIVMITFAVVSSLIWMWSAFVSDMHLSLLLPLNRWGCVLWDFWLQYAFGLNLMLTFIIVRLNWYKLLLSNYSSIHIRNNTLVVISFCIAPVIIVCIGVEYNKATSVDPDLGVCLAELGWKYALIATLLVNYSIILYLLYHAMRYNYISPAHKELSYGTAIATGALFIILIMNLTYQSLLVYGRIVKSFCIDITCLSFFFGLIGVPIFESLKLHNKYEVVHRMKDKERNSVCTISGMIDIVCQPNLYQHYLSWVTAVYNDQEEPWSIDANSLSAPLPIHPDMNYDSRLNDVFSMYTKHHDNHDPIVFIFRPVNVVYFLKRIELMLESSRGVDEDWKNDIQRKVLSDGSEHHVKVPYNLYGPLINPPDISNYKILLLCTKLWLLAQMEMLSWNDYISHDNGITSLDIFIKQHSFKGKEEEEDVV